jgi:hypothetical protein
MKKKQMEDKHNNKEEKEDKKWYLLQIYFSISVVQDVLLRIHSVLRKSPSVKWACASNGI